MCYGKTELDDSLSSTINDGLDCIEGVTEGVCGEVAAKHRRHVDSLFLQPMAELFLCELGKCKFWRSVTPWILCPNLKLNLSISLIQKILLQSSNAEQEIFHT